MKWVMGDRPCCMKNRKLTTAMTRATICRTWESKLPMWPRRATSRVLVTIKKGCLKTELPEKTEKEQEETGGAGGKPEEP